MKHLVYVEFPTKQVPTIKIAGYINMLTVRSVSSDDNGSSIILRTGDSEYVTVSDAASTLRINEYIRRHTF